MGKRPSAQTTSARRCLAAVLVLVALASLLGITLAYQDPALRKSMIYSGFGLC